MHSPRFYIVTVFVFALILTTAIVAASNFSGTWKLDAEKSESMRPGGRGPSGMILTITHKGDQVSVERTVTFQGQERTSTVKFKTDGSESTNKDRRDNDVVYVAKWDGDKLVITYTRSFRESKMEVKETWSLDGKVLTIQNDVKSSRGDRSYKSVFNKAE
jgi:hypothetical protein